METNNSKNSISARSSGSGLAAELVLPLFASLFSGEVADDEVITRIEQAGQALDRIIAPAKLGQLVEQLAKAIPAWAAATNRADYKEQLSYALQEHRYPELVVIEAFRRLVESADWMPTIKVVLPVCRKVNQEALAFVYRLECRRDGAVRTAIRAIERSMSDEDAGKLGEAERQEARIKWRRDEIDKLRQKLATNERYLPQFEAQLRQRLRGPLWATYLAQQHDSNEQLLAHFRAEIARLEPELQRLEAEPQPLAERLPMPEPRVSYRLTQDGQITHFDTRKPRHGQEKGCPQIGDGVSPNR